MTLLLLRRQMVVAASLAVVLVALSYFGVAALLADDPLTSEDFLTAHGEEVASARLSGSSNVAMYINEHPVSVAEVLESRAEMETSVGAWASAVARIVPDGDPSLREAVENGKIDYFYNQKLPVPAKLAAHRQPWVELWQGHGPDTMALANLIDRYAFLSAATEAGHTVTDAELEELVAARRQAVESAEVQPPTVIESSDEFTTDGFQINIVEKTRDHKLHGYIATVGEDTYWNTILPEKMRHDTTMNKWRNEATQGAQSYEERLVAVEVLHESAREGLTVEFTDAFPLDTTLEQVEEFLRGVAALKDAER